MQVTDKMVEAGHAGLSPARQLYVDKDEVRAILTAALAHREAEAVQVDANAIAENELQEIADGAWGDNPAIRGAARDRLAALVAPPAQEAVATDHDGTPLQMDSVAQVADDLGLAAPPAVPSGMVLVPVEPTEAMLNAIARADWLGKDDLNWADGWRIMLTAAQEGR